MSQAKDQFYTLAEISPDAIFVTVRGRFRYLNAAALRLFGAGSADELIGRSVLERIHPRDRAAVAARIRRLHDDAATAPLLEETYLRLDGTHVDVEVSAVPFRFDEEDEEVDAALVFARDITKRKRAEEVLVERVKLQDQFSKVAATVPGAVCSYELRADGSMRMPYASAALVEIYGLQPEEVREDAGPLLARIHPDDIEAVLARTEQSAREMKPWRAEYRVRHPHKGEIWIEGHSVPQREPDGSVLWHGYLSDVTERVNARQALEAARLAAEKANDAKTRFLAAASHDLRQPMQALGLLLAALTRRIHEPARALDLCARMEQALRSSERMLSRLMEFAALESGRVAVKREVVRLDELVVRLVNEKRAEAAAKGLCLGAKTFACATDSDPVLLERIVRNLIANAVRYTNEGGVLIGIRRRAGALRIEVRDTGIGIPPDKQALVFEEFQQLGNPQRDYRKGAGLGLAIVARTSKLLGHRLFMRSTEGKGSLFALEVPSAKLPQAEPRAASNAPSHNRRSRLLVVEDDPLQSAALEALLTDMGHEVAIAYDGHAAMQTLLREGWRPSLILTDYRLPGELSGIELILQARAAMRQDVPAIVITGDIQAGVAETAQAAGCAFLRKPYAVAELAALIELALETGPGRPRTVGGPCPQPTIAGRPK